METNASPAEELPALYRTILDGVATLEQLGQRAEAALVRAEATKVYSASWDERCRRRLRALCRRIDRVVAGDQRPRVARPRTRPLFERSIPSR